MKIRIEWFNKKTCAVTLIPGWFGRLFGAEPRRGIASRGTYTEGDGGSSCVGYFWMTTDRYVGWRVMRAIEAAPIQSIEDMSVEQLLLDVPSIKRGRP